MRSSTLLTFICLVAACTDGGDGGDDVIDGLGDLLDMLPSDDGACVQIELDDGTVCTDIEGAERFFAADLVFDSDDNVSGFFYIVLFANPAWQETSSWMDSRAGDSDRCVVATQVSGTVSDDGGSCGACDRSISYNVSGADRSVSDCPEDYVDDLDPALNFSDAFWGLQIEGDGSAVGWDTQRAWAPHGNADNKGAQLWSEGSCEWYGTGECS